jgi:hypothetical protein
MMQTWIKDLVAFVNDDRSREYGTTEVNEFKVATADGKIRIQEDNRWDELLQLSYVFSSN